MTERPVTSLLPLHHAKPHDNCNQTLKKTPSLNETDFGAL